MALTGEVDGAPMRFPTPIADMTCGLFTVIGILSALPRPPQQWYRAVFGHVAARGADDLAGKLCGRILCDGQDPPRRGNRHPQVVPYEVVQASDGDWVYPGRRLGQCLGSVLSDMSGARSWPPIRVI